MENALQLEGYLLKEKSKLSRLHGLTGDINKRYFRIRSVEVGKFSCECYAHERNALVQTDTNMPSLLVFWT